jgi:hypothetical protein
MKTRFILSSISEESEKGFVTLRVKKSIGLALKSCFLLTTKEAIDEAGVQIGDDITEYCNMLKERDSQVPSEDNPDVMMKFTWLEP